jgi:hypothetical protein
MLDEPEEGKTQGHENIRRVYALPVEMVDRIVKFQHSKGLSSEVEAVRRLLDEALKSRDDIDDIINRLLAKLGQTRIAAEAARDVLVGHPLVSSVSFGDDFVAFMLKNGTEATVNERGWVSLNGKSDDWAYDDKTNRYAGGSSAVIPF